MSSSKENPKNNKEPDPYWDDEVWEKFERINFPEVAHKAGETSLEAIETAMLNLLYKKLEAGEITQDTYNQEKARIFRGAQ